MFKRKIAIVFFLSLMLSFSTTAQEYKKFKVGLGMGSVISPGYGSTPGLFLTLEPAFRQSDDMSIGFRLEIVGFDSIDPDEPGGAIASYAFSIQYYFGYHKFRPFLGGGIAGFKVDESNERGGIFPRAGFDVGHFSLSLDYNVILPVENSKGHITTYLGFRIGGFFGGGRR